MKDGYMILARSNVPAHKRSARSLAKSLSALCLACLCLLGELGAAVAQARNATLPDPPISSQSAKSVTARLDAQNALFKQQYEDDLRASPESETAKGDYRDNAMLDD